MSFANLHLVIFGATGGIVATLVRQLAPLGCRLTLAARNQSLLSTLAGELNADACQVDVTDSDTVDRCLATASEKHGCLDGVVNCVAPGLTRIPLTASLIKNEATLRASMALHPPGRIGGPEEVASAIAWFLAPEHSWVTGQVLAGDAGLSMVQPRTLLPA